MSEYQSTTTSKHSALHEICVRKKQVSVAALFSTQLVTTATQSLSHSYLLRLMCELGEYTEIMSESKHTSTATACQLINIFSWQSESCSMSASVARAIMFSAPLTWTWLSIIFKSGSHIYIKSRGNWLESGNRGSGKDQIARSLWPHKTYFWL